MKKQTLTLVLIVISSVFYAQDWQWIKAGGSCSFGVDEYTIDIATDSDRNAYCISYIGDCNTNIDGHPKEFWGNSVPEDTQVSSFACDGTYRWSKIIGGGGSESITSVEVDSQDNVYVSGNFGSSASSSEPGRIDSDFIMTDNYNSRLYLAKFNKDGVLQWIRRPDPNIDETKGSLAMYVADDMIYWFVDIPPGVYANGAFTNTQSGRSIYVLKYDLNGNFIDATQIQGFQTYYYAIVNFYRNPYNGYYYLTWKNADGEAQATLNGNAVTSGNLLACWNPQGVYQWSRADSATTRYEMGTFTIQGLDFDANNNLYLSGNINSIENVNFLGFTGDDTQTRYVGFVMKLNPTADTIIWATHNTPGASTTNLANLKLKGNEIGVVVNGYQTFVWDNISLDVNSTNGGNIILARFDTQTGTILSLDSLDSNYGSQEYPTVIRTDANGDYIIGGAFDGDIYDAYGNTTTSTGGYSSFFITKYSTGLCNALSTDNTSIDKTLIYPNPSKDKLYIHTHTAIKQIAIYTMLGKKVISKQGNLQQDSSVLINKLAKGTYFIKITSNKGLETIPFIKE